ncbi:MAG: multifunctional oxoglutarate decarboxylase/oxoglutarate dehydrogenase thiamine pyrophosphate-binding subunit/dihydrolipoyllysine-residue succinyltransferase subunit [Gemmatimonadales bacterium]
MDPNVFETANAGFAQALYEEFLRDPASVSAEWRQLFESGVVGETPPPAPVAPEPGPDASAPEVTPSGSGSGGPPEHATLIKGPAARLVGNMSESLTVPTATSFRELRVANLDARRRELNQKLAAAGRNTKISFTHLIGLALVEAARAHPVMGNTLAMVDGKPYRITPPTIDLGLAVDMQRRDGSRGLVVPVIRNTGSMDFGAFHTAYEALVEKARTNKLMPDDFVGATITLTNPGGIGTVASVPRLMAGQGSIIAVGAIGYPVGFQDLAPDALRELGVSKVMTVTSTYDHRIIQGAESGEFLRTMDQLLQGEQDFYQRVAESMGVASLSAVPAPVEERQRHSPATPLVVDAEVPSSQLYHVASGMALVKALRNFGHLAARLDPLGSEPHGDASLDLEPLNLTPEAMASVPAKALRIYVSGRTLADAYPHLLQCYTGTIAYEVEHIDTHEERVWLRGKIESGAHLAPPSTEQRRALLQRLTQVESLEQFLHKAYLGQKRFSIEGLDVLVPMLDDTIERAAQAGANKVVIGMAHRGRLNVLAHTVNKPYESIFAEFEGGKDLDDVGALTPEGGTGDVKYHHGAEGAHQTESGKAVTVVLSYNPSHLEFVGPVVVGSARAEQTQRRGAQAIHDPTTAMPVIIHGDGAFAGQGIIQETFNLSTLKGYSTGGTLHIITNNQIGFTTDPSDSRSTHYASDLAKGFDVPIIHVNADDPEACLGAVRLAMDYRETFHKDVLIDLVGYRRYGHNEGDEPSYTQPLMAARIKKHPTVRTLYAERLVADGAIDAAEADRERETAYQRLVANQEAFKATPPTTEPAPVADSEVGAPVLTAVPASQLEALNEKLLTWPAEFTVNPKLQKQLERRRAALGPDGGIEWAHAEALALASLVTEGIPIRLTGQDTERGTFSQRHLVLHDAKTGDTFSPMQHLGGALAPIEIYNSPLSEQGCLGFEYGYSAAADDVLVLWEAQFGDFINGAQVIVDQFLVSGLSKWGLTTRLTLLLPHGYEGQGPEHSSARVERFLQLAAERNIRVANCTTPAQYFHLLRRQGRDNQRRPLIIMTPKSLLRLPQATSSLTDLAEGRFHHVLDDGSAREHAAAVTKVVLCSGKVYYDLAAAAAQLEGNPIAIVRVEQLYPIPEAELRKVLAHYPQVDEVRWVQEEPRNMGAWTFVNGRLRNILPKSVRLAYVGRPYRASTAEGYPAAHAAEQGRIVNEALGVRGA